MCKNYTEIYKQKTCANNTSSNHIDLNHGFCRLMKEQATEASSHPQKAKLPRRVGLQGAVAGVEAGVGAEAEGKR